MVVRARRSSDSAESSNTTATTHTVGTVKPPTPQYQRYFLGEQSNLEQGAFEPSFSNTVYDVGTNTYAAPGLGYTDFYIGATLIWRLKYDSAEPDNNGWWTIYGLLNGQVSGTFAGFSGGNYTVEWSPDLVTAFVPIFGPVSGTGASGGSGDPITWTYDTGGATKGFFRLVIN